MGILMQIFKVSEKLYFTLFIAKRTIFAINEVK